MTLKEGVLGMLRREAVAERRSSSRVKFFVIFITLIVVECGSDCCLFLATKLRKFHEICKEK